MAWPELLVLVRHAESEGNVISADGRAEYEVATHGDKSRLVLGEENIIPWRRKL